MSYITGLGSTDFPSLLGDDNINAEFYNLNVSNEFSISSLGLTNPQFATLQGIHTYETIQQQFDSLTNLTTGYWGAFDSNISQTAVSTNTAYIVTFNNYDTNSNGIVLNDPVGGGNYNSLKVLNGAVYNIQHSIQLSSTNANSSNVKLWIRLNGVDIQDSAGVQTIHVTNGNLVLAYNFIIKLQANDYISLVWATTDTSMFLKMIPATTSPYVSPLSPSAIITFQQVQYYQDNAPSIALLQAEVTDLSGNYYPFRNLTNTRLNDSEADIITLQNSMTIQQSKTQNQSAIVNKTSFAGSINLNGGAFYIDNQILSAYVPLMNAEFTNVTINGNLTTDVAGNNTFNGYTTFNGTTIFSGQNDIYGITYFINDVYFQYKVTLNADFLPLKNNGTNNLNIGENALFTCTSSSSNNIAFGKNSMYGSTTPSIISVYTDCIGIGNNTLASISPAYGPNIQRNIAIGVDCCNYGSAHINNVMIGNNICTGGSSSFRNGTNTRSVLIGNDIGGLSAGIYANFYTDSVIIGYGNAQRPSNEATIIGVDNISNATMAYINTLTIVGKSNLKYASNANRVVAIGNNNFQFLSNLASPNIAIGDTNWPGLGNGALNIVLGNFNDITVSTISNTTAIGNSIISSESNVVYLGSDNQSVQITNKSKLLTFQSFNSGTSASISFSQGEFISIGNPTIVTINLPSTITATQIGTKFQIIRNHTSPVNITLQVAGAAISMRLPDTTTSTTYTWISTESSISIICIGTSSPAYQIIENTVQASTANFVDISSTQTITGSKTFSTQVSCSVAPTVNANLTRKSYVDGVCTASALTQSSVSLLYPTMTTVLTNATGTQLLNFTNSNFRYNGVSNTLFTPSLNFSTNLLNPNKQTYNTQTELTIITGTYLWAFGSSDTIVVKNSTAVINIDVPVCTTTNLQTRLRIMKPVGAQIYILSIGGTIDILDENMIPQVNYLMTGSNCYIELSVITDAASNPIWFVSYSQQGNYAISANLVNDQTFVGTPTFNNLQILGNTTVNGTPILPVQIECLDGVSANIQGQFNNANTLIGTNATNISALQTLTQDMSYLTASGETSILKTKTSNLNVVGNNTLNISNSLATVLINSNNIQINNQSTKLNGYTSLSGSPNNLSLPLSESYTLTGGGTGNALTLPIITANLQGSRITFNKSSVTSTWTINADPLNLFRNYKSGVTVSTPITLALNNTCVTIVCTTLASGVWEVVYADQLAIPNEMVVGTKYVPNGVSSIITSTTSWQTTPPTFYYRHTLFNPTATMTLTMPLASDANVFEGMEFKCRRTQNTSAGTAVINIQSTQANAIQTTTGVLIAANTATPIMAINIYSALIVCISKTVSPYWCIYGN